MNITLACGQTHTLSVADLQTGRLLPRSEQRVLLHLTNEAPRTATIYLFVYDPQHQVFLAADVMAGDRLVAPLHYRYHFAQQFIVYPVSISAASTVPLHLQASNEAVVGVVPHPDLIPTHLPSLQHESEGNFLELALCSMVFMMGLYIALKFIQLRTKEYGFYALYILFTFLHFLVVMLAKSWAWWYEDVETRIFYHRLFQLLSHVAYFQFFRYFTHTPVQQPIFDRALQGATWVGLGLAVADALLVFVWQPAGFSYGLVWTVVRIGFSVFVVVSLAFWVARSASPLRKYLIAGNTFLILGGVLTMVWNAFPTAIASWPGILSHSLFYFRAGVLFELLFFSMGLGFKQRLDEQRRQEAESRLEKERLALEKAREVDAAKSSFFTNISHEFRTPLSLIQGPAEQIARTSGGLYQREVDVIVHQSQSLLRLVNQMLELSKLEVGEWKLQVQRVSLRAFLSRITESFAYLAAQKQQQWRLDLPEDDREIYLDPHITEAIVQNLFSNAAKYTPAHGSIELQVRLIEIGLVMEMKDNGPGIAPKALKRIFDRFYRVEGSDQPGAGIGLTLVRELVRIHKGTIQVLSEPGRGATFVVNLSCDAASFSPQEWGTADAGELEPVFVSPAEEELKLHRNGRLMVLVEDHAELRGFLADALKDDFNVQPAQGAAQAWELIRNQLPDLVLTDWMMPGESGLELCRKIKDDILTNHIPVVMLTARASEQSRVDGWQGGADDYISKPFSVHELRARLVALVAQRERLRVKYAGSLTLRDKSYEAEDPFFAQVQLVIRQHLSQSSFSVEQLAREVAVSRVQLHRKLTAVAGCSPGDLIRQMRLEEAARLLQKKEHPVAEVAYLTGFESPSHFARVYRQKFGYPPSDTPK